MRTGGLALIVFLGLAALAMAWQGAPALAHAELLRSTPADGETLSEQPGEVRLVFDEPVRAEFDPVKVTNDKGDRVDDGEADTLTEDPDVLVAALGELPQGAYAVEWRVTSADGDPISGGYGFSVGESAVGKVADDGRPPAEGGKTGAGGPSFGVVLGVVLAGGLVVAGFVMLRGR